MAPRGKKSEFSLADAIKAAVDDVSNLDTGRDQIDYIALDKLEPDERNFYALDGVEELAANIELVGLQQPLRVRSKAGDDGGARYLIVSGHRRRAALELLVREGKARFGLAPCIVERDAVSPAMQELRLIYANNDTRRISDADLAKQAERVTELLYQLKGEGIEFPGRMRDHVAEACNTTTTKLARLKVIREQLPAQYMTEFEAGTLSTDAAYQLAKAPEKLRERICRAYKKAPNGSEVKQLSEFLDRADRGQCGGCLWEPKLQCPDGKSCTHGDAFLRHDATCLLGEMCGGVTCCLKCDRSTRDYYSCSSACTRAKVARAAANSKKKEAELKKASARQRKYAAEAVADLARLMPLIDAAGLNDHKLLGFGYISHSVGTLRKYAAGDFSDKELYGADFKYSRVSELLTAANLLHCSTDYLLGLTDEPVSKLDTTATPQWRTGTPSASGKYWCTFESGGHLIDLPAVWDDILGRWEHENGVGIGVTCRAWYPLPADIEEEESGGGDHYDDGGAGDRDPDAGEDSVLAGGV